jgi:hypothetical protein
VSGCREGRGAQQARDDDDPLAVLWYAIVREVDLANCHVVACLDERVEQVKDVTAASSRDETLDVLEDHHWWSYFSRKTRVHTDERRPVVGRVTPTG